MAFIINRKEFKDQKEYAKYGRGCITKNPSHAEIRRVDEEISSNKLRRRIFKKTTIQVKFIHLTYGNNGHISKDQRTSQIDLLNKAFAGSDISFSFNENETLFIDNYSWYYMGHGSFSEREAKTKLANDSTKCLNFYTGGLQQGLLGWATFPFDLAGDPIMDGVVVLDESLPNGDAKPYNLGMTGVHEVGHWLGLYHTFQGGCDGIGDHVHDTAPHSGPNYGKPEIGKLHNACGQEPAPIHNYMNYVDDDWMRELTDAQEKRVKDMIQMYRTGLLNS